VKKTPKKRAYDAEGRRTAAEQRKQRILDAAKRLFACRGIDDVTIAEIAEQAEVAGSTIYAVFASKAGILRELMRRAMFNPEYAVHAARLKAVRDPVARVRMTAAIARSIYEGERNELAVLRGASAFSRELRDVEHEFEGERLALQRERVVDLADQGLLRPELTVERARHVMWTLTSREVFRMLVTESGWTPDEYETWLADTLVRTLTRA
jgi:AcrR family transcriptional regulator